MLTRLWPQLRVQKTPLRYFSAKVAEQARASAFDEDSRGYLSEVDTTDGFYKGLSVEPFSKEIQETLIAPVEMKDVECKPDGLLYLPEIKYRRILIKAFGVGGWGLVPRSPHTLNGRTLSREYALFCLGKFVSQARGEQQFFGDDNLATASEGVKSNALMRCCKDLGIASELWDPAFVKDYKDRFCTLVPAMHLTNNSKKYLWKRRDRSIDYPFKEISN